MQSRLQKSQIKLKKTRPKCYFNYNNSRLDGQFELIKGPVPMDKIGKAFKSTATDES